MEEKIKTIKIILEALYNVYDVKSVDFYVKEDKESGYKNINVSVEI